MSCPHTETTAILAAFGEAPADFEQHLEHCMDCRSVMQEHLQTLSVLEPALHQAPEPIIPANPRFTPPATGFLIAAAILLGFQFTGSTSTPAPSAIDSPLHTQITVKEIDLFEDSIDTELALLEMEIALFNLEES
jgi:hypothetical protein